MPDWSYQPFFRPLLYRLPAAQRHRLVGHGLALLGRRPWGPVLIEGMGHFQPAAALQTEALGVHCATPIGLGAGLDPTAQTLTAVARFGVGFAEVGPVSDETALTLLAHRLRQGAPWPIPLGLRITVQRDPAPALAQIRLLGTQLRFVSLDCTAVIGAAWPQEVWQSYLATVIAGTQQHDPPLPVWVVLPAAPIATLEQFGTTALSAGVTGLGIGATTSGATLIQSLRARWGEDVRLLAAGGPTTPGEAQALFDAGANLVTLDHGLVESGPGLPKRINEMLSVAHAHDQARAPWDWPWRQRWLWWLALGLGMLIGGLLAAVIAVTRVVLPYDEAFVGLQRSQLHALNGHLLAFMAHDRMTLAGTMISIGVLYIQLAWHGVRWGVHWARRLVRLSASVGFASYFLWLGFGYFDPLHTLVTVILLPCLIWGWPAPAPHAPRIAVPDHANDRAWRLALWGQGLFVSLGAGLLGAGAVIALVGMTNVLVAEDQAFLQTTAAQLQAINPRILSLIAHDRAGFGGALVADGIAVLGLALWGVRRGAAWVWWTLLAGGLPGFVAALGIHGTIGYTDQWHLAPAWLGLLFFVVGLILLRPYLLRPPAIKPA